MGQLVCGGGSVFVGDVIGQFLLGVIEELLI